MGLFGQKREADKVKEDRELISFNEKSIASLIVLAEGNDELIKELQKLQEKLKYLTPTSDSKISDFDKKIKNTLQDLKVVLIKTANSEQNQKINMMLSDIKLLIADRKAKE